MKKVFMLVVLLTLFCAIPLAFGQNLNLPNSEVKSIEVFIENNSDVVAFNGMINPIPTSMSTILGNKFVEYNEFTGAFIIYGLNTNELDESIPLFTAYYDSHEYGDITIIIDNVKATNGQAVGVTLDGGEGIIAIRFSEDDIHATAFKVIEKTYTGVGVAIDINKDGAFDSTDVQAVQNNI